jgi:intracellular sulfur oxidation DsrE/DsrF family protein
MRVVFHLSSGDVDEWRHTILNVRNLLDDGSVDVDEAVLLVNGDAIDLFGKRSPLSDRVRGLASAGVRCVGCRNSLAGRDRTRAGLLANVELVPSGVGELARLQDEGYAYLKVP